jgi:hypothetical protein
LSNNLLVQQLSLFRIRTDFAVSSLVVGIVNSADSHPARSFGLCDRFPATAEERTVNRAQLIAAESHGFLQLWLKIKNSIDGTVNQDS